MCRFWSFHRSRGEVRWFRTSAKPTRAGMPITRALAANSADFPMQKRAPGGEHAARPIVGRVGEIDIRVVDDAVADGGVKPQARPRADPSRRPCLLGEGDDLRRVAIDEDAGGEKLCRVHRVFFPGIVAFLERLSALALEFGQGTCRQVRGAIAAAGMPCSARDRYRCGQRRSGRGNRGSPETPLAWSSEWRPGVRAD